MIKSYFELEITSCLMFIVSRPQKEYLFLKYISKTRPVLIAIPLKQFLKFCFQSRILQQQPDLMHGSNRFKCEY